MADRTLVLNPYYQIGATASFTLSGGGGDNVIGLPDWATCIAVSRAGVVGTDDAQLVIAHGGTTVSLPCAGGAITPHPIAPRSDAIFSRSGLTITLTGSAVATQVSVYGGPWTGRS